MGDLPVAIVGGGIIGLAVGRELTRRFDGLEVVVFEKESQVGLHQTGHNSGVVHAGIYYKPGSLKADLCTRGRKLLAEYCLARGLPYEACGKLVVAVDQAEIGRLDALEQTAKANGVPGLRRVDAAGIVEIEPNATGLAALHSPSTAITDFSAVARAYSDDIIESGGRVVVSSEVTEIRRSGGALDVITSRGSQRVGRLFTCAGLQSDRVSKPIDGQPSPRIVPFRGEYMEVTKHKRDMVRGLIYPVPDPQYPFLGVHYTRMVGGALEVGPNAILALSRERYGRTSVDLADVKDIATWPGFWRLARKHWKVGAEELVGSLSKRAYMTNARRYVPEIGPDDVVRARSGIRAQALDRDGTLVDDFRIFDNDGVTSIRNAPSPGATSSLAIAEWVVDRMVDRS